MRVPREEIIHKPLAQVSLPLRARAMRVPAASSSTSISLALTTSATASTNSVHNTPALTSSDPHSAVGACRATSLTEDSAPDTAKTKIKRPLNHQASSSLSSSSNTTSVSVSVRSSSSRPFGSTVDSSAHVAPPTINLHDLSVKLKKPEWSVRQQALESLNAYVAASAVPNPPSSLVSDVRLRLSKIYDLYLAGLVDNHARCLDTALIGLSALLETHGCGDDAAALDALVPRICGSVLLPPSLTKVRAGLSVHGRNLLEGLKRCKGVEACAMSAAQALNNPEFAKGGVRVRVGCLGLLAELTDEEWQVIVKDKPACKFIYVVFLYFSHQ